MALRILNSSRHVLRRILAAPPDCPDIDLGLAILDDELPPGAERSLDQTFTDSPHRVLVEDAGGQNLWSFDEVRLADVVLVDFAGHELTLTTDDGATRHHATCD